ncbi:MAG: hypothetical protein KY429_02795 [Actinobacteria bacterium]|nr:hypothetical protein [Actinomycetota bacterium]
MSLRIQIGLITAALASGAALVAVYPVLGDQGAKGEQVKTLLITIPSALVFSAVIFGWAIPKVLAQEASKRAKLALTSSVIGLLLAVPLFWTGLGIVFGMSGAFLTMEARDEPEDRSRILKVAFWLGALVVAFNLLINIFEPLSD